MVKLRVSRCSQRQAEKLGRALVAATRAFGRPFSSPPSSQSLPASSRTMGMPSSQHRHITELAPSSQRPLLVCGSPSHREVFSLHCHLLPLLPGPCVAPGCRLFSLQESLKDQELCVFFRNNHFSTLFKVHQV